MTSGSVAPLGDPGARPQLTREQWLNLNGEWTFEIDHGNSGRERGILERELAGERNKLVLSLLKTAAPIIKRIAKKVQFFVVSQAQFGLPYIAARA